MARMSFGKNAPEIKNIRKLPLGRKWRRLFVLSLLLNLGLIGYILHLNNLI